MGDSERLIPVAARLLIDKHGIEATSVAENMAEQRFALGDTEGAQLWRRVKAAIAAMQRLDQ